MRPLLKRLKKLPAIIHVVVSHVRSELFGPFRAFPPSDYQCCTVCDPTAYKNAGRYRLRIIGGAGVLTQSKIAKRKACIGEA